MWIAPFHRKPAASVSAVVQIYSTCCVVEIHHFTSQEITGLQEIRLGRVESVWFQWRKKHTKVEQAAQVI